jgi:predicted aminopeptidase
VLTKREPIERVIGRPATSERLRQRLQYVLDARHFAVSELRLPDNASYRSYADLQRSFVVWNVFATRAFSIEPRRWCFPIAGCVVYRGYFSEAAAQRYARKLRGRGYDASVGGVSAYSTLGHFSDPVLNTMMNWSDAQLASTLFHELAHQVIYVPGDSEFNEAFAMVVEEEGLSRWLQQRNRAPELAAWRQQRVREAAFAALLLDARQRLRELYGLSLDATQMRYRKLQLFGDLKYRYSQLKATWSGYSGYDHWFDRALDNSHLVAVATYRECVPRLQRQFIASGSNFEQFYERMRKLVAQHPGPGLCGRPVLKKDEERVTTEITKSTKKID